MAAASLTFCDLLGRLDSSPKKSAKADLTVAPSPKALLAKFNAISEASAILADLPPPITFSNNFCFFSIAAKASSSVSSLLDPAPKLSKSSVNLLFSICALSSASEILIDTKDVEQRLKLINILNHDVQRIERLITDYSQILKDEVALSKEKFKKVDILPIIHSVVDDYNNIYQVKRGIKISCVNDHSKSYLINGIENRIEQIIANLLDNAISFSEDSKNIEVRISKNSNKQITVNILDEGQGFKEKDTTKIFKRFYSNRPDKFGQHSGLGLNIVKNLVELHKASITASNRSNRKGANLEIIFPNL